ncbi:hypothetical protein J2848_006443 [Azospirillum lipoferum]|uniref:DUF4865 family protein n=1 Tax=Azospirillum lipoferum TaxID=193 RepID=A0A5A9GDT8_AZOLI|nr:MULTISPECIES: DUF4865 family protein [Azospirillum]KAA0591935.1 DUF4865 family protein [Azospirillum lipoferum]MCP1614736.1 hypothetical protein [Azospirillum lipoferum]MDW5537428.1 DUF4865 family protein [Azospirillum sp. NL1]
MIAMQYSFVLPADYDMTIIDRRVREKGPLLDGFPRLRFKAYLAARKQDAGFASAENLYAPFYLWDEPEGIDAFLSSPGFAAVSRDFGWPSVQTWLVRHAELTADLKAATHAIRETAPIAPYSDLASQRDRAITAAKSAIEAGALAAIAAFDPTKWMMAKFTLWPRLPPLLPETMQIYTVGHISLPDEP